jgi:hypothetical protein
VNSRTLFPGGVALVALSLMASSVHAGPVQLADKELDGVTAGSVGTHHRLDRVEARLEALNARLTALVEAGEARTEALSARAQALIQALLLRRAALERTLSNLKGDTVKAHATVRDGEITRTVRAEGKGSKSVATATASAPNGKGKVSVAASAGPNWAAASSRAVSVR